MTDHSRRDVIAGAALALTGTAVISGTAQPQTTDGAKTPTGDPQFRQGSVIKTRTASCNCGQLRATCTGPDPHRISLCNCKVCQKLTGSAFSLQATFPKEQVTIEGRSTEWRFPIEGAPPVPYRKCSRTGVALHFCPMCGSTVYYVLDETPNNIGVKVGAFADPTFPAPNISGFEEYKFPWVMDIAALPMPGGHHA
jgi:hypothetical protein